MDTERITKLVPLLIILCFMLWYGVRAKNVRTGLRRLWLVTTSLLAIAMLSDLAQALLGIDHSRSPVRAIVALLWVVGFLLLFVAVGASIFAMITKRDRKTE